MRIPGEKRSSFPDACGNRAGAFAQAIRDGNMDVAWAMLSKETRGMRMGVWATRNRVDMQDAYRAGYDPEHPMRPSMLDDFRKTVLSLWPLEDLTDLGISPTSYVDDKHAFTFLPFGMQEETTEVETTVMLPDGRGMIIGGLIKEEDIDRQSKIPLLGGLWVVGRLFQRRTVIRKRSEIIIALVPRVVSYEPHNQFQEENEVDRWIALKEKLKMRYQKGM